MQYSFHHTNHHIMACRTKIAAYGTVMVIDSKLKTLFNMVSSMLKTRSRTNT